MQAEVPVDPTRVHFVGRLTRPDYLSLLQVSALHLYLTVPFVLSWSCIEALAAGCLVLGSDVAPVREVIEEGLTGALVDARDPQALARRASTLLAERAGWGPVRARARRFTVEQFELRRCLETQSRLVREMA
jgi:glycosyltransferase involved in cell wall biosynthesis